MAREKFLLDTHVGIWIQEDVARTPAAALRALRSPASQLLFSQISLFEMSIKMRLGKLQIRPSSLEDFDEALRKDGVQTLPVQNQHVFKYLKVPLFAEHRDPFDRLLIATAIVEEATIITADKNFRLYTDTVNILW